MTSAAILCINKDITKAQAEKASDVMLCSSVSVAVFYEFQDIPRGLRKRLHSVWLKLGGKLTLFPSKSNVSFMRSKKRDDMKARLHALTQHYAASLIDARLDLPEFGSDLVHVSLFCGKHSGRFDSHNQAKALGDWLEAVSLIENDSQAEIHVFKKEDYPREFRDCSYSDLIIQRRDSLEGVLYEAIAKIKAAAGVRPEHSPKLRSLRGRKEASSGDPSALPDGLNS